MGGVVTSHCLCRVQEIGERPLLVEIRSLWENCYSEFFDGRFRHELLDREIFYTRQKAQILIEWWRQRYNTVRRHSVLGYRPPAPATRVIPIAAPPSIPSPRFPCWHSESACTKMCGGPIGGAGQ